MNLVDTHTHLNDEKYAGDLPDVIERARNAGVTEMIVCGYDLENSKKAVKIASEYNGITATAGIHPHNASDWDDALEDEMKAIASDENVVAWGETGLDYYHDHSPRDVQKEVFYKQIGLAFEARLPLVIHSREAAEDTFNILSEMKNSIHAAVVHCFSENAKYAKLMLDMGFYIGIDGPVTYDKTGRLESVVDYVPLDRLLLETDCPYMAPVPHRGKRNEPAYTLHIAEAVAKIKQIPVEEVAQKTTENSKRLFGRVS